MSFWVYLGFFQKSYFLFRFMTHFLKRKSKKLRAGDCRAKLISCYNGAPSSCTQLHKWVNNVLYPSRLGCVGLSENISKKGTRRRTQIIVTEKGYNSMRFDSCTHIVSAIETHRESRRNLGGITVGVSLCWLVIWFNLLNPVLPRIKLISISYKHYFKYLINDFKWEFKDIGGNFIDIFF